MIATTSIAAPLIRYHGGKFRLAPWIIQHMPAHRCYVEPFGGAASVVLRKPRVLAEIYNDLDGDVVTLFRVLQDETQRERLFDRLVVTPSARAEFELAWKPAPVGDDVECARRIIIRAQMGFGSAGATKGSTGFRCDSRRKYGTAHQLWATYPDLVSSVAERLQGVLIECRPAIDVMQQHDAEDTLHYVDPPYVHATRVRGSSKARYYRHEMQDGDHEALIEVLRGLRGMVLLSGYPSDLYHRLLPDWRSVRTSARISAGRGTAVRTECLWMNDACYRSLESDSLFPGATA